jgi:hypothetical protein
MAGGVSQKDARSLANSLYCEPDFISRQPKGTFATYVRGVTDRAVPLSFPFGVLEGMAQATDRDKELLRILTRERYAEPRVRPQEPPEEQGTALVPVEERDALPATTTPDDDIEPL